MRGSAIGGNGADLAAVCQRLGTVAGDVRQLRLEMVRLGAGPERL